MSFQKMYENEKNWITFWNCFVSISVISTRSSTRSSLWKHLLYALWPAAPNCSAITFFPPNVNLTNVMADPVLAHCVTNTLCPFWRCSTTSRLIAKWSFAFSRFNARKSTSTGKAFSTGAAIHSAANTPQRTWSWTSWFQWHCASFKTSRTLFPNSLSRSSRASIPCFTTCTTGSACSRCLRTPTPRMTASVASANATVLASAAMPATKARTNNARATALNKPPLNKTKQNKTKTKQTKTKKNFFMDKYDCKNNIKPQVI